MFNLSKPWHFNFSKSTHNTRILKSNFWNTYTNSTQPFCQSALLVHTLLPNLCLQHYNHSCTGFWTLHWPRLLPPIKRKKINKWKSKTFTNQLTMWLHKKSLPPKNIRMNKSLPEHGKNQARPTGFLGSW